MVSVTRAVPNDPRALQAFHEVVLMQKPASAVTLQSILLNAIDQQRILHSAHFRVVTFWQLCIFIIIRVAKSTQGFSAAHILVKVDSYKHKERGVLYNSKPNICILRYTLVPALFYLPLLFEECSSDCPMLSGISSLSLCTHIGCEIPLYASD